MVKAHSQVNHFFTKKSRHHPIPQLFPSVEQAARRLPILRNPLLFDISGESETIEQTATTRLAHQSAASAPTRRVRHPSGGGWAHRPRRLRQCCSCGRRGAGGFGHSRSPADSRRAIPPRAPPHTHTYRLRRATSHRQQSRAAIASSAPRRRQRPPARAARPPERPRPTLLCTCPQAGGYAAGNFEANLRHCASESAIPLPSIETARNSCNTSRICNTPHAIKLY